jgi:hypothetical protein
LNANEHSHRFANQIGLVHFGIGYVQRALIEFIIDGDRGSQEQALLRIKDDAYWHQLGIAGSEISAVNVAISLGIATRNVPAGTMYLIYIAYYRCGSRICQ